MKLLKLLFKKKAAANSLPFLEQKNLLFKCYSTRKNSTRKKKKWYKAQKSFTKQRRLKLRLHKVARFLVRLKLPKRLSFLRWILVDFLRGKNRKFWGVYSFVALPGQGKTMAMVAHMERARKQYGKKLFIITNFHYKYADRYVEDWPEMLRWLEFAHDHKYYILIGIDEVHLWWDSHDYATFPKPVKGMLSLNRKYNLEFLCSAQIHDNIPKPIRDLSNYFVLCKNKLNCDRLFLSYYFEKSNYDSRFDGKRKKADFIRDFIADDYFYSLYDTKERIKVLMKNAADEKALQIEFMERIFGKKDSKSA